MLELLISITMRKITMTVMMIMKLSSIGSMAVEKAVTGPARSSDENHRVGDWAGPLAWIQINEAKPITDTSRHSGVLPIAIGQFMTVVEIFRALHQCGDERVSLDLVMRLSFLLPGLNWGFVGSGRGWKREKNLSWVLLSLAFWIGRRGLFWNSWVLFPWEWDCG